MTDGEENEQQNIEEELPEPPEPPIHDDDDTDLSKGLDKEIIE